MACRRSGDKPLYKPMMVSLLTHICVTQLQWGIMAWCHQATSNYLRHCWPRSTWPNGHNELTHWGQDKMATVSQTTFSNAFSRISIKISLKFVPKGPINNIPALIQIMAWLRSGDKPLSEPMLLILLTHICVTRPQRVNYTTWMRKLINSYSNRPIS